MIIAFSLFNLLATLLVVHHTSPAVMDNLASFSYLLDNLPSWLSKLDELSTKVSAQHAKFVQLTESTELKLARQKTGSTESLRPNDRTEHPTIHKNQCAEATGTSSSPDQAIREQANAIVALQEARRKRKPGSALSAASGPVKYRTRSMVIVYYDSEIQQGFESLVRNIAGARNNLRKAKTAASFKLVSPF